ncbi:unnamed protein product [Allacma fusca]|uniref:Uncharacterized protein n=1 Tax=Allacma fusca TaxID=39272 RepID=A0A8J2JFQ4_9HEXA|nr:unnamed protein product [Allacma fusca]
MMFNRKTVAILVHRCPKIFNFGFSDAKWNSKLAGSNCVQLKREFTLRENSSNFPAASQILANLSHPGHSSPTKQDWSKLFQNA